MVSPASRTMQSCFYVLCICFFLLLVKALRCNFTHKNSEKCELALMINNLSLLEYF